MRQLVLTPDGTTDTWAAPCRRIDNAMVKAIARAFCWGEVLETARAPRSQRGSHHMADWIPMFALPNIRIIDPVEIADLAAVYADDKRIKALGDKYATFEAYLNQFSTEFGDKLRPSLLIWNDGGPQSYRNTEALAAFRDALALSVVPYVSSRILARESQLKLRFTNWFSIYPWMMDKNYEYVVMRSSAVMGLHEAKLLQAQTYPGLNQELINSRDIDQTLHRELMFRFKRRFTTEKPEWNDIKLFRSLNMANVAAQLPSNGDFTPYDSGRAVALWASAFEILAHPGEGQSGHLQVYELLEKAVWHSTACKEARHPCMAPIHARRPRILACAIYSRMHTARNDYLHGNSVSDVQLSIEPSKRFLLDYAPVLYRMALTGFLGLQFTEAEPGPKNTKAFEDWFGRAFEYQKYQRDMEVALATFDLTIEQQRRRSGRDDKRTALS